MRLCVLLLGLIAVGLSQNTQAYYAENDCKQFGGKNTCVEPLAPKVEGAWTYYLWNSSTTGGGYPFFVPISTESEAINAINKITSNKIYQLSSPWLPNTC